MELDSPEARLWIAALLHCPPDTLAITPLGGGISNHVVLVDAPGRCCVFKQSLERLRVAQEWRCGRDRIFREWAALEAVFAVLPPGAVPRVLLKDHEEFTFAM